MSREQGPRRPRHPMPDFVLRALGDGGLMEAYRSRPPYQQNDYIGWITEAKRPATQEKRLAQMLEELAGGGRYMRMVWRPPAGNADAPAGEPAMPPRPRDRSP